MTTFKAALAICGLSQQQAANYLGVGLQSIKHWSSGRSNPPQGVWGMLADLYARIEAAADFAAVRLDEVNPRQWGNIEVDLGCDPLPDGASSVAGAIALLIAINDATADHA